MTQDLDSLPPTLTVDQAAEVLGISRSSVYRAANTSEIPTIRIGRRILIPTARLRALLQIPTGQVESLDSVAG